MKLFSRDAWRRSRKWRSYFLVVLGAYVLMLGVASLFEPLRANLENLVFDQYQRWHPRPYNLEQPVRIVDIDDESNSPDRPMAVAAPHDGGPRRQAGAGECRGDRLRRPVLRKGPADRQHRGLPAHRSPSRRRPCAVRGAGGRRCGVRARDRGSPGGARRISHPDSRRHAGEPDDESGLLLHRGSAGTRS